MRANYQVHRSQPGFRIALATLPESECVAVSFHVPAGGRDDPESLAGLAHFVEHMTFKGTERRDARRISLETEDAGASLNAYTSEDQTAYEGRGDADSLPLLIDMLCDMVWHSSFPEAEVRLEHDVIAEEIVMYHETPSDHIGDLLSEALWSPHSLGNPISGSLQSIAKIGRGDLRDFALRHHCSEDLVISIAGPFEMDEVLGLLKPKMPSALARTPSLTFAGTQARATSKREPRETAQIQLALGYRCFGRSDERRHALRLLSTILGEGASSRLFQKLREERGLCYQVGSDVTLLADTGALEIHAGLDPDSRDEAIRCITGELEDLASQGPSESELMRAKRLHASHTRAAMESTASHAGWIGDCILHHDSIITPEEALKRLIEVQTDEIRQVARELIRPENEALAEIYPA